MDEKEFIRQLIEADDEAGQQDPATATEPEQQAQDTHGRTFSQDDVNELVGRARKEGRESAMRGILGNYGLESEDGLSELIGNGQMYGAMKEQYDSREGELAKALEENALLKAGVPEDRWDDVRAIMTHKGMALDADRIREMAQTHPEWMGQAQPMAPAQPAPQTPTASIQRLGGEPRASLPEEDEEAQAMRMLGLM